MKCCIISIGDELVRGLTVNTNASIIALELLKQGYSVERVITVGDHKGAMSSEITSAMQAYDVLILTGGLGPTADDLTRQVLSKLFDRPLKVSLDVKRDLETRYGPSAVSIEDQSMVLDGAKLYLNPLGTAPGFSFQERDKMLVVLPGPPLQMQAIFPHPLADIMSIFPANGLIEKRYLFLLSEARIDPFIREWEDKVDSLSIGVCPSYGTLSVYFWIKHCSAHNKTSFNSMLEAFDKAYEHYIYSSSSQSLEKAVIDVLKRKKKSVALAESCSGGLGLSRLTDVAGASEVLLGGWVSYSNEAKKEWLGVPASHISTYGAVSIEVAESMAEGALKYSKADYSVSITGIAGPSGGSRDKPVGTVCIAIGVKEGDVMFSLRFLSKGSAERSLVKTYSVNFALSILFRYIKWGIQPFEELSDVSITR